MNILAYKWYEEKGKFLTLRPDSYLDLNDINMTLWKQHEKLEPFGIGNNKPLFWSRNCEVVSQRNIRGGHLKFSIIQGEKEIDCIFWKAKCKLPKYIDIAFYLSLHEWQGKKDFQLEIQSVKEYKEIISFIKSKRIYKCFIRNDQKVVLLNELNNEIIFSSKP